MNDWASRRKAIYLGATFFITAFVAIVVFWNYWYVSPTCTDGRENGDETGVDCGGSCQLICRAEALQPIVRWDPRLFEVWPNVWSVIVYVENPNLDAYAAYVPYTFTLYDENNQVVATRTSATLLPRQRTVGIFEGAISVTGERKPRRVTFEIGKNIVWKKNGNPEANLRISHSPLLRLETAPRIEATVSNTSLEEMKTVELVAAIFDGSDNTIAASRTFIDRLPKGESVDVFFTWPRPFQLGVRACSKPSDTVLLLDRSGSMASEGTNPPQPLTAVKEAAQTFIDELKSHDQVSLASFATLASNPIDNVLTSKTEDVKSAVEKVHILRDATQYTNIYDALRAAWQELLSPRAREESRKAIVLLTDGVATHPQNPNGRTEEDDLAYASELARKEATLAKQDTIEIYTIGLGRNVDEDFLKNVATKPENYFFAPSTDSLKTIYKKISSDICEEVPARVEITSKVLDRGN